MKQQDTIMDTAGMPPEIQMRMKEIIEKHAEGYRRDLPALVASLRTHVENLNAGRNMEEATAALEREAHDMKGQAATFGLPHVAALADSLCKLIGEAQVPNADTLSVIDDHVSALNKLLADEDAAIVEDSLKRARHLTGG